MTEGLDEFMKDPFILDVLNMLGATKPFSAERSSRLQEMVAAGNPWAKELADRIAASEKEAAR